MNIQFPKKLFSEAFYDYLFNVRSSIEINFGGAGSGKTAHGSIKNVFRMIGAPRYEIVDGKKVWTQDEPKNILAIRQVYGTLADSVYTDMQKAVDILGFESDFVFKRSPQLKIECKTTNKVMLFRGLDDVEKIKGISVKNGAIDHFDIEEITETKEESTNQLSFRTRGGGEYIEKDLREIAKEKIDNCTTKEELLSLDFKKNLFELLGYEDLDDFLNQNKTMSGRFNPVNKGHWVHERFFKDSKGKTIFDIEDREYNTPELYIHHSTHWDNPFLTIDDHIKYESYKFINKYFYDVYCCGRWGVLGDRVFENVKLANYDSSFFEKRNDIKWLIGLDFGFNPDPNALIRTGISESRKEIHIVSEWVKSNKSISEIHEQVKSFLWYDKEPVYCDWGAQGSQMIHELNLLGVNAVKVVKYGKASFKPHGVSVMQDYTIYINTKCPITANEVMNYCWEKDSNGNSTGKPDDGTGSKHQNTIDAGLFYALNSVLIRHKRTVVHGG